jgi:hypothetical protein
MWGVGTGVGVGVGGGDSVLFRVIGTLRYGIKVLEASRSCGLMARLRRMVQIKEPIRSIRSVNQRGEK